MRTWNWIRFELEHSVLGIIPAEDSNERAVVTAFGSWQTVHIQPGDNTPFVDGTVTLRIVAEGSAAKFYLDAWSFSNTPFALPWEKTRTEPVSFFERSIA